MTDPVKRVLSCSVFQAPSPVYWRNDRTEDRMSAYIRFLPVLVRAYHAIWPDWELRIHHDRAVCRHRYWGALERMHGHGLIRLVDCGPATHLCLSMLWRLWPAFDPEVEIVLTHDVDSLPLLRLRRMADEFADSGKAAMVVHACDSHDGVLGGGLGVRASKFRKLINCEHWSEMIALGNRNDWNRYSSDEDFQRCTVWPLIWQDAIMFRNEPKPTTIACSDLRPHPSAPPPAWLLTEVRARGDNFAPYIGSAGYEVDKAFDFYDGLDIPAIRQIAKLEQAGT